MYCVRQKSLLFSVRVFKVFQFENLKNRKPRKLQRRSKTRRKQRIKKKKEEFGRVYNKHDGKTLKVSLRKL